MNNKIINIPLPKNLFNNVVKYAAEAGYKSVKELVVVLLKEVATDEPITLSKRAEKRYGKILADVSSGKNVHSFSNASSLLLHLTT